MYFAFFHLLKCPLENVLWKMPPEISPSLRVRAPSKSHTTPPPSSVPSDEKDMATLYSEMRPYILALRNLNQLWLSPGALITYTPSFVNPTKFHRIVMRLNLLSFG